MNKKKTLFLPLVIALTAGVIDLVNLLFSRSMCYYPDPQDISQQGIEMARVICREKFSVGRIVGEVLIVVIVVFLLTKFVSKLVAKPNNKNQPRR